MKKRKRRYVQIVVSPRRDWYCDTMIYTDRDEPLRLTRKKMASVEAPVRVYLTDEGRGYWRGVMLATHRTSDMWVACTEKGPFSEAWPVFEAHVRML